MYALVLSLLLHLFLIGQFSFHFPNFNESRHVIEARLALPKVAVQVAKMPAPKKEEPRIKPVEIKPETEQLELPQDELPSLPESMPTPDSATLEPAVPIEPIVQPELVERAPENQQAQEIGVISNPKPYRYVESAFDVFTDSEKSADRTPAGSARVVYQLLPSGEQYKIESLIQAKGLAALLIPDLLQTSEGYLDPIGLQPAHYLYQFGDKKDKTYRAEFDWESKKLTLHTSKGEQKLDLAEGTQDLLSFMYQFMFVPPLQNMQILITNGKKLGVYDYSFEGEELIETKMGELNTLHLLRQAAEGEKKTELWLALDYRYVPVKIRETDKDGKVYELLVTDLKTEQPAIAE